MHNTWNKNQNKFQIGDRAIIKGKAQILDVIEIDDCRVKVREYDTENLVLVEFWLDSDQLEYPDKSHWSPLQMSRLKSQNSPGFLGISNKMILTGCLISFISSIAVNVLLNGAQNQVHPLSKILGSVGIAGACLLVFNASQQKDFKI